MNANREINRIRLLLRIAKVSAAILFVKIFLAMVYEYRHYFPPDFMAADFLFGRQDHFFGSYRTAFYVHIITGPVSLVLASLLMVSGKRKQLQTVHRRAGRVLFVFVIAGVVPSGLVMSTQSIAGPLAGWGFALHGLATTGCMLMAVKQARRRNFVKHQQWATRCFLLLSAPILLRLASGALIVLELDSDWTYRANAWLSWTLPLLVYEIANQRGVWDSVTASSRKPLPVRGMRHDATSKPIATNK
jgi:hypothetical protein